MQAVILNTENTVQAVSGISKINHVEHGNQFQKTHRLTYIHTTVYVLG